jgi:hypothetical protein
MHKHKRIGEEGAQRCHAMSQVVRWHITLETLVNFLPPRRKGLEERK